MPLEKPLRSRLGTETSPGFPTLRTNRTESLKPSDVEKVSIWAGLALLLFLLSPTPASAKTLTKRWSKQLGGPITLLTISEQGIVLAGSSYTYGLTAFNSSRGEPLWQRLLEAPPSTSPAILNRRFALKARNPRLMMARLDTGEPEWRVGPLRPALEGTITPLVGPEVVVTLSQRGWLNQTSFDGKTNRSLRLPLQAQDRFQSEPVLLESTLYAGTERGDLWSIPTTTPRRFQRFRLSELIKDPKPSPFPSASTILSRLTGQTSRLAFTTLGGDLFQVNLPLGRGGWKRPLAPSPELYSPIGEVLSHPIYSQTSLLVSSLHQVVSLEPDSGQLQWKRHFDRVQSPVGLDAGQSRVVVVADGHLHLLDPESGQTLASAPLTGQTTSGPVVGQEMVIVGSDDGQVTAFEIGPDER